MRWTWGVAVMLLAVRVVAAEPVTFEVKAEVPVGQKPMLRLTATQAVSAIKVDLERDDGKHFTTKHPGLGKGQNVTLPIGDGAAGKATYKGTLSAQVAGAPWSNDITFQTIVRAPLEIGYDIEHLDLDQHVLLFKPSRAVAEASLVALGEDGKEIGKGAATYKDETGWLPIPWTQPPGVAVMMLKLRVAAGDGAATNLELIPWSVSVEHQDVNFNTDSAAIETGETEKLDASLTKIAEVVKRAEKFMKVGLYIAGHTDTVGPSAKNRKLSLARALAIGTYFRKHGLAVPIVVAGFGEEVLKVKTGDETDERGNRRADYVLGPAGGSPPFKGPYLKVKADWKPLR